MPGTSLFGVSNDGRVYVLSTTGSRWHELDYLGIEFKHVSAVPNCVWAVGGDRQIYLHVHGLDIPIRVKEESYENQRWLPFSNGFSNRLLPTDRYYYSNDDGTVDRSWDKIELPSRAWAWESDWQKELVMEDGQPLDHEGWMYAVDFPATYTPQKHFNSFVRKRKWFRYRRYVALNSWCALPPLHRDPTQEPFIDVSVGGHQIASCEPGTLCVWAITVQGRLLFRSGITAVSPEGSHWAGVPMLPRCEPAQLSVSPTGHVWCVLWDGRVLVRDKISREQLQGELWLDVSPPELDGSPLRLRQVAAGLKVAWAITTDGSVWFRRGISIPDRPAGNGWVPMTGDMAQVSVGANDQVWAVGSEDRCIYFRTGILPEEMTGRTWRKVQVGVRKIRTDRASTSSSTGSSSGINISASPGRHHVHHLGTSAIVEKPTHSFMHKTPPQSHPVVADGVIGDAATSQLAGSLDNLTMQENQAADISALLTGVQQEGACSSLPTHYVGASRQLRSVRDSSCSLTQLENRLSGTDSESDSVFGEDEEMFMTDFMPRLIHETDDLGEQSWNWVAAGACMVDPTLPPAYWFTDFNQSKSSNKMAEPWRNKIMEELKTRSSRENDGFGSYEAAIETNCWVKSGQAKVMLPKGGGYEECIVELEWASSRGGNWSAGTLSILSTDKSKTKAQINISELAIVMVTSEPGMPRLSLYERRNGARLALSKGQHPVCLPCMQLVFTAEKDMEDWQAHFNTVCCNLHVITGAPGPASIWATTLLGDVFVWDPATVEYCQTLDTEPGVYRQELATYPQQLPCEAQLINAFPLGAILEITGRPFNNADRFTVNIQSFWGQVSETSRSVALHFNPRFKDNCVVRNSMDSGVWGMEEREGNFPFEKNVEFCLRIECHTDCFVILVNGEKFTTYSHRLRPEEMGFVAIQGSVSITNIIYETKKLALAPSDMFWRQIGGHLRKVETCDSGIVWGLGFDGRAWVYTGGWGGGCFGVSDTAVPSSTSGTIHPMTDTQSYYVYENQRWNPLTGYSARGLPTDRPPWSDKSGKQKCSKEKIRLRSMHWQWQADWAVDFHVSGGVDKEGWQYAVDFPASYHSRKRFTDYVRRRRWERKCTINTSGPWMELGGVGLQDITLRSENGVTTAWAIAAKGDPLYRFGISKECPQGEKWLHIPCDQKLCSISLGKENKLWAVGRNGSALWRFGITPSNPTGTAWVLVDPPSPLQQISVSNEVWALDKEGKAYLRREVSSVFPEGTHWLMSTDTLDTSSKHVRQISCGPCGLWAVLGAGDDPGAIGLRCGITSKASSGISWNLGTSTGWLHISARSNWLTEDQ